MKITHAPVSPFHGGPRTDGHFQGGSEPPTKTPDGAARSEDTDPAVSIQLSEEAQQHVAPAATGGKPGNSGNSANSPAHRARVAMETYAELGQGPFGQLVSQIARGVFTEPTGSGEGEAGQGTTTDETAGETTPDGATEPGGALPDEPEVVADEPEVVADEPEIAAGDEPAPEGGTVAAGDEPAPEGGTVVAGDEPAPEGETVAAGDEPDGAAAAGATESLAAAAIVADAAAIEAELIDELLEETTAE